ncbi:UNVERIFIED_CONTAM: hypothetical protein RMT77_018721 [Armadillidium vulgare]
MRHMVLISLFASTFAASSFSWSHFSLGEDNDGEEEIKSEDLSGRSNDMRTIYSGSSSAGSSVGQEGLYSGRLSRGIDGRQGEISYNGFSLGGGSNEQGGKYFGGSSGNNGGGQGGYSGGGGKCSPGQVQQIDGSCVAPDITKSVFIYQFPEVPSVPVEPPFLPKPKLNYNVVFVHTPEQPEEPNPIVIPPPKDKTLVYVLTKNEQQKQQVIEVPEGPNEPPKVLYVNYNKGDNPSLPGGFQLQEILNKSGSPNGGGKNNGGLGFVSSGGSKQGGNGNEAGWDF